MNSSSTPLVVVVFNRPDHARALRRLLVDQESRDLYVIVDGPRGSKVGERALVEECVSIFKDWPGQVQFNISDKNLGCKVRISTGLDWVFERTERAIILEDDLSPSPMFFKYCDEMLEAYADSPEVMSVCGTKTYPGVIEQSQYFFSTYNNCWGWATWRRAWTHYSDNFGYLSSFQLIRTLKGILGSYRAGFYWFILYQMVVTGKRSSWAYCWMITCFLKGGLHVYPASNLVVNNGFGADSTHTSITEPYMPRVYGRDLSFPVLSSHVEKVAFALADTWIEDNIYSKSVGVRLEWLKRRLFKNQD
ncbi:hypothetical protein BCF53_12033 [Reinekea marinisedimentorum]|uniref:Glycosyl transferase family 2 n=2 Tax=Reinekea marinisedimentorum TaxID=230495 RepID=A0A4R3HWL5_9GAMM|nr:hypothetical protein BCF53_12033 [Reinekea marinisedimentorum]